MIRAFQYYDALMSATTRATTGTPSGYLLNVPKSVGTAYVLLAFFGLLGVHRFYIRSIGLGIAYVFTLGFLGIGVLVDLFILSTKVHEANVRITIERGSLP